MQWHGAVPHRASSVPSAILVVTPDNVPFALPARRAPTWVVPALGRRPRVRLLGARGARAADTEAGRRAVARTELDRRRRRLPGLRRGLDPAVRRCPPG